MPKKNLRKLSEPAYVSAFKFWKIKIKKSLIVVVFYIQFLLHSQILLKSKLLCFVISRLNQKYLSPLFVIANNRHARTITLQIEGKYTFKYFYHNQQHLHILHSLKATNNANQLKVS